MIGACSSRTEERASSQGTLATKAGAIQLDASYCPNGLAYDNVTFVAEATGGHIAVAGISVERSLVVWETGGTSSELRGRLIDNNSSPEGSEITLGFGDSEERNSAVSAKASQTDNRVVVAWQRLNPQTSNWDVWLRTYYESGSGLTPSQSAQRATSTSGDQVDPQVQLMWDTTAIVAAWRQPSATTSNLRYRMCNSGGQCGGSEHTLHSSTATADRREIRLDAFQENSGFVAVWRSNQGDGTYRIFARVFEADGTPVDTEIEVSSGDWDAESPDVATLSDDRFVVTWLEPEDDQEQSRVWFRIFNYDGTEYQEAVSVAYPGDVVGVPRVASFSDGSLFAVAYPTTDLSTYSIYMLESYETATPDAVLSYINTPMVDPAYHQDHDLDAMQCDSFVHAFMVSHDSADKLAVWYPYLFE